MIEKKIVYYEEPSFQTNNSRTTLELARARADELGIKHVVVASSSGESALLAKDLFTSSNISLVVVSDRAGVTFKRKEYQKYGQHLLPEEGVKDLLASVHLNEKEEIQSGIHWKPEVIEELNKYQIKTVIASEPFRTMLRSRVNPAYAVLETLTLFGKGLQNQRDRLPCPLIPVFF